MNRVSVALREWCRTVTRFCRAIRHGRSHADIVRKFERGLRKPERQFDEAELVAELNGATGTLINRLAELRLACRRARSIRDTTSQEMKDVDRCVRVASFSVRDISRIIARIGFFDVTAAALSEANFDMSSHSHKVQSFVRAERLVEEAQAKVEQFDRMTIVNFVAGEAQLDPWG